MDWDKDKSKTQWIDKHMTYTAASMRLVKTDVENILKKLDDVLNRRPVND